MENCARCGKQLLWNEVKLVFWNKQLKQGYIKWYVIGSRDMGKRKEFPQYKGKKLCQVCAYEVFTGEIFSKGKIESVQPKEAPAIADFADLKQALVASGVIISAFNCPKCSSMLDIPESGKLLICKHCGNPIKPTDIYEKIKTLM